MKQLENELHARKQARMGPAAEPDEGAALLVGGGAVAQEAVHA